MQELEIISTLLNRVWESDFLQKLFVKKIDVSLYNDLKEDIPDKYIFIEDTLPQYDAKTIWDNFKSYGEEVKVFPILGTLGASVICVGYGDNNLNQIFYYDFDFGIYKLNETLDEFVDLLVDKTEIDLLI